MDSVTYYKRILQNEHKGCVFTFKEKSTYGYSQ